MATPARLSGRLQVLSAGFLGLIVGFAGGGGLIGEGVIGVRSTCPKAVECSARLVMEPAGPHSGARVGARPTPEFLTFNTLQEPVTTQRNHFFTDPPGAKSTLCGEHKDRNDPDRAGFVITPFQYMSEHQNDVKLFRGMLDAKLKQGLSSWEIGNSRTTRGEEELEGEGSAAWQFCHMLPLAANQPWVRPSRYTVDDVVVGVFTGALFYRSRAQAALDTWLQRWPHHYFYSRTEDDILDVVRVDATSGYAGSVSKQNEGMKHMLREHPDAAWYYLVGCDTWVHPEHLLLILDEFDDPSVPLYVGGNSGKTNLAKIRVGPAKVTGPGATADGELIFHSGGSGFLLSNALMKKYVDALDAFVEEKWPEKAPQADVLAAWLCNELGVGPTTRTGFHGSSPDWVALTNHNLYGFPAAFHHLTGLRMVDLDEFYAHQRVDRMANAHQWEELETWVREFIGEHYRTVRRKYLQINKLSAAIPRTDVDGAAVNDAAGLGRGNNVGEGGWTPWATLDLDELARASGAWG